LSAQTGVILWFTGLPSAGKSTLARAVGAIVQTARPVEILDGDEVRTHLSRGLGFSRADRDTNVLRIGFVARLLARHGIFVITAAISPYAAARDEVRRDAEAQGMAFIEVFVSARLETVVARDVKGLYRRALAGEIPSFTGISDPYEPPEHPEMVVHTDRESVDDSVGTIVRALVARGLVAPAAIG
jgi:adenylylsulfate kinase